MQVPSLGQEEPLEEGMATHPSILAWRIPGTEEPAGYGPWGYKSDVITRPTDPVRGLRGTRLHDRLTLSGVCGEPLAFSVFCLMLQRWSPHVTRDSVPGKELHLLSPCSSYPPPFSPEKM